jgi:hypothetical protein
VERADPRILHPFTRPASLDHPLLDLLGVGTVVHGDAMLVAELEQRGLPLVAAHEAEGLAWHDRPGAGPRAFLCGGAQVEPDAARRLAVLADPGLEPFATVWLERTPPGVALPAQGPMQPAQVLRDESLVVELASDAPIPGVLVLTEAWDPGWSANVDGAPAEVLVADHALLGVALPAGAHVVRLGYAPPGAGLGHVLGLLGLVLLVALAARARGESRARAALTARPSARPGS